MKTCGKFRRFILCLLAYCNYYIFGVGKNFDKGQKDFFRKTFKPKNWLENYLYNKVINK